MKEKPPPPIFPNGGLKTEPTNSQWRKKKNGPPSVVRVSQTCSYTLPEKNTYNKLRMQCLFLTPIAAQNVFCFSSASKCFCVPKRTTVSLAGKLFQLFIQLFSCRCRRLLLWQKTFACFGDMKTFWTKGSREGEELSQKKESRGGRDKYSKISPFSGINLHVFFGIWE